MAYTPEGPVDVGGTAKPVVSLVDDMRYSTVLMRSIAHDLGSRLHNDRLDNQAMHIPLAYFAPPRRTCCTPSHPPAREVMGETQLTPFWRTVWELGLRLQRAANRRRVPVWRGWSDILHELEVRPEGVHSPR